jgi:succinoglycan biosynthesis protein ExoA
MPVDRLPHPPLISVCILAGHGIAALDACLASLRVQASPPPFEPLIGGNPTPEMVAVVHNHFPDAQLCRTGRRLPGAARNPLIERARGELLLFLDDDVTAPPGLLRDLAQTAARYPEASVFGGPNDTPPGSTRFQVVQGAVLSSIVGAGPVSRRYGARQPGPADERWFTLCNLAVRRRVMSPFVSHLVCAEENALLAELRSRGERMRYEPCLRVFHARRGRWLPFARQMFKYGRGRGELLRRAPGSVRAAYLAPAALLIYLPLALLLAALGWHPAVIMAPAVLYCVLTIATALRIGWTLRALENVPLAAALVLTIHLCYGAGILRGLQFPGRDREVEAPDWTSPPPSVPPRVDVASQGVQPPLEYHSR